MIILSSCSSQSDKLNYPESKKVDFSETLHGYEIEDSYRWLEEFTSEESIDWMERQNQFTKKFVGKNKFQYGVMSL